MTNLPDYIVIIGAGRISYSIAAGLKKAGWNKVIVISNNIDSAKQLADLYSYEYCPNEILSLNITKALFLLTVPDEQILVAANRLAESPIIQFEESLFIHFSGALSLDMLEPLKKRKAKIASMHIMQTFNSKSPVLLDQLFCAIESEDIQTEELLFKFAKFLRLRPQKILSENKASYHLAGVFASNFLFSNLYFAGLLMDQAFSGTADTFDILGSLIKTSLDNAEKKGVDNSITGPLVRGDLQTVTEHLAAINKMPNNNLLKNAYVVNSLNILAILEHKNHHLTENQKSIKEFLSIF